mgnify:CR=1 FL=1
MLGEAVLGDLREDFVERSVALPPGEVERAGTGDLVTRATTDTDRLTWAVRHAVPEIAIAVVSVLVIGAALIVTAPVMAVADARIIGRVVDKTLFVVRWDTTPRKVSRAALNQLRQAGNDIVGTVLQQVDLKRYGRFGYGDSGYYYHYGRYGKYYSG